LAAEKLRTKHGIDLAKETVRQLQIAANAFMPSYVDHYNAMFSKVPRSTHNAHRPVRSDEA
jgi:hypothetical protein